MVESNSVNERAQGMNDPHPSDPNSNDPYPNAQSSNNEYPYNPYAYNPYTYNPYYYPPYNPYFHQPRKAKKYLGLTLGMWVLITVLGFIGFSVYGMYALFSSSTDSVMVENFSQEVIIAEGGYFRFIPDDYYYEEIEITLSISERDNKNFDVYLLDEDQFFNAYYNNVTNVSFSAGYSFENTSVVEQFIPWTDEFYDDLIIVIDNRELDITPNDASPDGKIIVDVDIMIRTRWEYAFD